MSEHGFSKKLIYKYDVALSFAGEDREYVEATALILKGYGIKVFYDKFEEANLWGKDLFSYLKEVYSERTKYTIMFISEHYKNKLWTTHERKSMQERAFRESEEYILPVRFDNTEISGLHETIGYIDLKKKTPSELVDLIIEKLNWKISNRWWGCWKLNSHWALYHGELSIRQVDKDGFYFNLKNFNGAHIGEVEGKAIFKSKNEATFTSEKHEDWFNKECIINFIRTNDIIQITENACSYYHGMSSHFDGDYNLKKDAFYDLKDAFYYLNIFDDLLLSNVYALLQTEENWRIFSEAFNNIYINDKNEAFKGRIITGGAAGLYGIYEAILMISPSNEVWGAYLYEEKVYFFTNSIKSSIPQEILRWGENFRDMELIVLTKI